MPSYEVAIYNSEVKEALANGKKHERVAMEWADVRFLEVTAMSEGMARSKIEGQYPSSEGFVIEEIMEV